MRRRDSGCCTTYVVSTPEALYFGTNDKKYVRDTVESNAISRQARRIKANSKINDRMLRVRPAWLYAIRGRDVTAVCKAWRCNNTCRKIEKNSDCVQVHVHEAWEFDPCAVPSAMQVFNATWHRNPNILMFKRFIIIEFDYIKILNYYLVKSICKLL